MFLIDKKKRKEKNSVIYQWVIKVKVQTGKLRIFQENIYLSPSPVIVF